MRIRRVLGLHVRVPLETPYVISRGRMNAFDSIIVRIETDDLIGYGESVPLSVVGNPVLLADLISGPLGGLCEGADPFDVELLINRAESLVGPNIDALAGLDLALWDLMGKALGQPVFRLLGGLAQNLIEVTYTIGAHTPQAMAEAARSAYADCYRTVVVKATGRVDDDISRVRAVRGALPASCRIRVDCNGGFARGDALRFLRGVADLGLEFVEQPVAGPDLEGMQGCRKIGVPISADESLNTAADALALVQAQACDFMNVKVPKVGGLLLAKRIAAVAAAAGVPVVVGGRTTLELSRYASRHYAASTPGTAGRGHEGPGPASQALSDDVVSVRTSRVSVHETGGFVRVEHSPGLGAEGDWQKVERYAVR